MIGKARIAVVAASFLLLGNIQAQGAPAPLSGTDTPAHVPNRLQAGATLAAARAALQQGFPSIALNLFEQALAGDLAQEQHNRAQLEAATAALALERPEKAAQLLEGYADTLDPAWRLRRAVVALSSEAPREAERYMRGLTTTALPEADRPWYLMALGLLAELNNQAELAGSHYLQALEWATTPQLRARIDLQIARLQIRTGQSDEALVVELRRQTQAMAGQRGGFESGRLLAIALAELGRRDEALRVIQEQLQFIGVEEGTLRYDLLVLLGQIAGPGNGQGRLALQEVLTDPAPESHQRTALALLSEVDPASEAGRELKTFLQNLWQQAAGHPLAPEMGLLQIRFAVQEANLDEADLLAETLIERFPTSRYRNNARLTLAHNALRRETPRYRTAAHNFNLLRNETAVPAERDLLGRLVADCFFSNADYETAAAAYGSLLRSDQTLPLGPLVFQKVLAEIRAGMIPSALNSLDQASRDFDLDPTYRWQAEWNILNTMKRQGQLGAAFLRLDRLLTPEEAARLNPGLRLRLLWLRVTLAVEAGEVDDAPAEVDALLALIQSAPASVLPAEQRNAIASQSLLLKGRAYYMTGQTERAGEVFNDLRQAYAESPAAVQSLLIQARYLASEGQLVEAQQQLITLADTYADHPSAPIAIWEAALLAEQRALASTYREAASILERLLVQYPEHPLAFNARIRQADLSRQLQDFATALLLYEEILASQPEHPERYRAEMGRADSLLARASQTNQSPEAAQIAYERIAQDTAMPADVRAEAGFKWGYVLERMNRLDEAEAVYWQEFRRALEASGDRLPEGSTQPYWLARMLFQWAQALQAQDRYTESAAVYRMIEQYKLPGQSIALAELEALRLPQVQ